MVNGALGYPWVLWKRGVAVARQLKKKSSLRIGVRACDGFEKGNMVCKERRSVDKARLGCGYIMIEGELHFRALEAECPDSARLRCGYRSGSRTDC